MKTFLTTFTGGEPRNLADIRWWNQGLFENTLAILSSVCPVDTVVILSGCERTVAGSIVSISAGWVQKNGEIFRCAAHSFTLVAGTEYWSFNTLFDPVGLKAYNTLGVTHDTYQEVVYKVVIGTPPVGSTVYSATPTLMELITNSIVKDAWQVFKTQTFGIGTMFPSTTFQLSCMYDLNGFVHIQGEFGIEDPGNGAVDFLFATLPVGYRPISKREYLLSNISNAGTGEIGNIYIHILPNGEIRLKAANIGFAGIIDFAQIVPFMRAV